MSKEVAKILIIEDEKHIAEGIKLNLTLEGYEAVIAKNGREGLEKWQNGSFDLIILDLMLPVVDGHGVLKKIRSSSDQIPIFVVSAKDQDLEKVKALEGGVDDYITKPFHLDEFLLRIKALLRRSLWSNAEQKTSKQASVSSSFETFEFGSNKIDFVRLEATCSGKTITLTLQEIKLLELFFNNIGRPLTRKEILKLGWGVDGDLTTRTIDNFIVRFRKYFEIDPRNPSYFKSVRSVGYIFQI